MLNKVRQNEKIFCYSLLLSLGICMCFWMLQCLKPYYTKIRSYTEENDKNSQASGNLKKNNILAIKFDHAYENNKLQSFYDMR